MAVPDDGHKPARSKMITLILLSSLMQVPKEKEPKVGSYAAQPSTEIVYIGRGDYKCADGQDPLLLRVEAGGKIIADKPVEITDDDLKVIVPKLCKGQTRVSIVIGVMEPDKSTLRTISDTINRIKKYVPARTAVKFVIEDYDL
jgi:hypothetical protein